MHIEYIYIARYMTPRLEVTLTTPVRRVSRSGASTGLSAAYARPGPCRFEGSGVFRFEVFRVHRV